MRFVLFVLAILLIMPNVYAQDKNNNIDYAKINSAQVTDSKYTFEDNAMSGKVVKLKKGTELPISLKTPIDTSTAQENDVVEAFLNDKLEIDGTVVAEQGSIVKGKVIKSRNGSSGIKNGKVSIVFDKIITTENRVFNITTKKIDFVVSETGKWISVTRTFLLVLLAGALTVCTGGLGAEILVMGVCALGMEFHNVARKGGTDTMIPALTPVEVAVDSSVNVIGNYEI
jgi:hypothetical protein